MPHCYSEEAWQKRRSRAVQRGYIQQRPSGQRYIMVDGGFQLAMKAAYRSLKLHFEHDMLTGLAHHHGRQASRYAKQVGRIDENQFEKATRAHRIAGKMKHSVSRKWIRTAESSDSACPHDELFVSDPWAGMSGSVSVSAAESCDEQEDVWRPWCERLAVHDAIREPEAQEAGDMSHLCAIVDVVANESCRVCLAYIEEVKARVALPSSGESGVVQESVGECKLSECISSYDECDDAMFGMCDGDVQAHRDKLQKFVCEWESVERLVKYEAEGLEFCIRLGEDEWWNSTLEIAEQLEDYAAKFTGGDALQQDSNGRGVRHREGRARALQS